MAEAKERLDRNTSEFARKFFSNDAQAIRKDIEPAELETACKKLMELEADIRAVDREANALIAMGQGRTAALGK
eukprot:14935616-Alexandrium_andersonii.AAC.1